MAGMQASMANKAAELIRFYSDHLMNNYSVNFDAESESLVLTDDQSGEEVASLNVVTDQIELV